MLLNTEIRRSRPLLALLRNTPWTEDQVKEVVREISDEEANASTGHEVDDDEIEKFIEGVTHRDVGSENVKGAATPTAAGRPLHGVDEAAVREHPSAQ